MKYWLTTHWPPRTDEPAPFVHERVCLQDDKLEAAEGMSAGDLVLIYESASGKAVREAYPDGTRKTVQRRAGRQGVVCLARVLDRPSEPEGSQPEHYTDGTQKWWRFKAPTEALNSTGFIPRTELAILLGYKPTYPFRGFGKLRSGLAELEEETFRILQSRFLRGLKDKDTSIRRGITGRRWGGPGGEGPAHLALKSAIAADPAFHLSEPGLTLWETEYKLPTGDTIDVVLRDEYGRFVVVEVEVDCDATELVGPLQCAKYRALMSYLHDRPISEVRAILVAYSIDDDVKTRCSSHEIACEVRARNLVPALQ